MDAAAAKETQHRVWAGASEAWAREHRRMSEQSAPATAALLDEAGLKPGMRVLDLAGGTGEPSISAAKAVGGDGHVVMTDFVQEMVDAAQRNAGDAGLTNMEFRRVDAEQIPFDDDAFDAVTCRFGVMFFPEPVVALREVRRVLKPGGRAVFAAWGPPPLNPFFLTTNGILVKHGVVPPPDPSAPGIFRFAQSGSLSAVMRDAGLTDVRERDVTIPWDWAGTPEDVWRFLREGTPFRASFERAPAEKRQAAEREILETFQRHYRDGMVRFQANFILASARK